MNTINNLIYCLLIIFICSIINNNIENKQWILQMIIIYVLLLIFWLTTKTGSNNLFKEKLSTSHKIVYNTVQNTSDIVSANINTDQIKTSRINAEFSDEDSNNLKCPDELKEIPTTDSNSKFCSDDGKFGKINNTCSLTPNSRKNYPICDNYPCPEGLKLVNPESGGICQGGNQTCVLDPNIESSIDLCYSRPDYNKINNYGYSSNFMVDTKSNLNIDGCKIACDNMPNCSFFTMNNNNCQMYNMLKSDNSIKYKTGKSIYFKNPFNYLYEDDVTIDDHTIQEYKLHSVNTCASKCNDNNKCRSFVWGKNEHLGDCILKSTSSKNKKGYNSQFDLYSKKYVYHDNKGSLCKNHTKDIQNNIKSTIEKVAGNYYDNIYSETIINDKLKEKEIIKAQNKIKNTVIKNFINLKNIMWNNIQLNCNIIHITKQMLNTNLTISNIQIYGSNFIDNNKTINLTTLKGIKIKVLGNESNLINKLFDNNLNNVYSTKIENNPKISIIFPNIVRIYKIIIYGDQYNIKNNLFPIKIELYKDNLFIKHAIQEELTKPIVLSKDPPKLPTNDFTYESRRITDFGDETDFKGWVDVSKNNANHDYCRVITDPNTKTSMVSCATTTNPEQYSYNSKLNLNLGVKKTQYMKDESRNGRADFCRCIGKYPNSYVSCIEGKEKSFGDEFIPVNKPTPCDGYTGEELSNFDYKKKTTNKCRDNPEYLKNIKSDISTGYYNYKQHTYYLFKNTIINNKNIVLITALDKKTHRIRRGYPQILTRSNWPNLPSSYYESIDAILYVGNNSIIIFKDDTCIFYNLVTQSTYTIDYKTNQIQYLNLQNLNLQNINEPPLIRTVFPNCPFNKVTAAANVYPNTKNDNDKMSIFYKLLNRSITNTNPKKINTKNIINFYKLNPKYLDSNIEAAKIKQNLMKKMFCDPTVNSKNNIISKMYKLLCPYYIPPCNLYYKNKFITYSLTTNGISQSNIHTINNKTIPHYNYSEVGTVISFHDSSLLRSIIFYKNIYFINSINNKIPIYKKIYNDYPNIWKINLNNLGKSSKNIIKFKMTQLNNFELPLDSLSMYNIQIKIYEKQESLPENLLHYLEFNKSNDFLINRNQKQILRNEKLPIKELKIFYNKDINPQLLFKIIINSRIIATTTIQFDEFYTKLLNRNTLQLKFKYNEDENQEKSKFLNNNKIFPELFIKL